MWRACVAAPLRFPFRLVCYKLRAGCLSNLCAARGQLSFLLFLKQLDERELDAERSTWREVLSRLRTLPVV